MKLNLHVILLMFRAINQLHIASDDILGDEFMLYNEVNSYQSIDLMLNWFEEKFKICFNAIAIERTKSGRKLLDKAKEFIHANINSDITLDAVAEHIHLSANYFSKLFRQEVGKTFKDYVITYRINKAKQLLDDGIYKVNEVSNLVGFNDIKHFYKVFKRKTGFTPSQYKDR